MVTHKQSLFWTKLPKIFKYKSHLLSELSESYLPRIEEKLPEVTQESDWKSDQGLFPLLILQMEKVAENLTKKHSEKFARTLAKFFNIIPVVLGNPPSSGSMEDALKFVEKLVRLVGPNFS